MCRTFEARSSMKLAVIGIKVTTTVRFNESGFQIFIWKSSDEMMMFMKMMFIMMMLDDGYVAI